MLPQPDAERSENPLGIPHLACTLSADVGSWPRRPFVPSPSPDTARTRTVATLQPAGFHQFITEVADDFGGVQQVLLLAVAVSNRPVQPTPDISCSRLLKMTCAI